MKRTITNSLASEPELVTPVKKNLKKSEAKMDKINLTKVDRRVAITGMSSRLPECDNLEEFKRKLYAGEDMVNGKESRWPSGLHGLHTFGGK